jgi:hypothetical protein
MLILLAAAVSPIILYRMDPPKSYQIDVICEFQQQGIINRDDRPLIQPVIPD